MLCTTQVRTFAICLLALGLGLSSHAKDFVPAGRLNNLVSELARTPNLPEGEEWTLSFVNPRDGWVYLAVEGMQETSAGIDVRLEMGDPESQGGGTSTRHQRIREGMWNLKEGRYQFRIGAGGRAGNVSVVVRAVPELHYCRFPADPVLKEYGAYDWGYLEKHVLPHVNTIVGNPTEESDAHIGPWVERGGKWIAYGSLPHNDGLTADQAFEYWSNNPGFTDPRLSGLIADEFQGRQNRWYPAWTEAMRRLGTDPALKGKAFYGYCGGPGMYSRPQTRKLVRTVFEAGYYMAWERYLHEMPTLESAKALLDSHLGQEIAKWRATFPECQKQMVLVSGLFTHGLSLDVQPEVDYKDPTGLRRALRAPLVEFGFRRRGNAALDGPALPALRHRGQHGAVVGFVRISIHSGSDRQCRFCRWIDWLDGRRGGGRLGAYGLHGILRTASGTVLAPRRVPR